MKTTQEIFKEVLEELGFAEYKPDQMTNSDYWLCTCTAMERYARIATNDGSESVSCCLKILRLTLSWSPFEVMHTGEKSTEYRKPSKWIESRLIDKEYDLVEFINGYGSGRPVFIAEYLGFDKSRAAYQAEFSNGLKVDVEKGDYKIYIGKVLRVANLPTGGS